MDLKSYKPPSGYNLQIDFPDVEYRAPSGYNLQIECRADRSSTVAGVTAGAWFGAGRPTLTNASPIIVNGPAHNGAELFGLHRVLAPVLQTVRAYGLQHTLFGSAATVTQAQGVLVRQMAVASGYAERWGIGLKEIRWEMAYPLPRVHDIPGGPVVTDTGVPMPGVEEISEIPAGNSSCTYYAPTMSGGMLWRPWADYHVTSGAGSPGEMASSLARDGDYPVYVETLNAGVRRYFKLPADWRKYAGWMFGFRYEGVSSPPVYVAYTNGVVSAHGHHDETVTTPGQMYHNGAMYYVGQPQVSARPNPVRHQEVLEETRVPEPVVTQSADRELKVTGADLLIGPDARRVWLVPPERFVRPEGWVLWAERVFGDTGVWHGNRRVIGACRIVRPPAAIGNASVSFGVPVRKLSHRPIWEDAQIAAPSVANSSLAGDAGGDEFALWGRAVLGGHNQIRVFGWDSLTEDLLYTRVRKSSAVIETLPLNNAQTFGAARISWPQTYQAKRGWIDEQINQAHFVWLYHRNVYQSPTLMSEVVPDVYLSFLRFVRQFEGSGVEHTEWGSAKKLLVQNLNQWLEPHGFASFVAGEHLVTHYHQYIVAPEPEEPLGSPSLGRPALENSLAIITPNQWQDDPYRESFGEAVLPFNQRWDAKRGNDFLQISQLTRVTYRDQVVFAQGWDRYRDTHDSWAWAATVVRNRSRTVWTEIWTDTSLEPRGLRYITLVNQFIRPRGFPNRQRWGDTLTRTSHTNPRTFGWDSLAEDWMYIRVRNESRPVKATPASIAPAYGTPTVWRDPEFVLPTGFTSSWGTPYLGNEQRIVTHPGINWYVSGNHRVYDPRRWVRHGLLHSFETCGVHHVFHSPRPVRPQPVLPVRYPIPNPWVSRSPRGVLPSGLENSQRFGTPKLRDSYQEINTELRRFPFTEFLGSPWVKQPPQLKQFGWYSFESTSSHRVSGPMPNPAGLALPFTERVTNECVVYLHRRFIKPTGWQLAFGRHVVSQEKRLQAIDQTIAMESSRPDESALHWGWDSLVFGHPKIPVIRIYPDSLNDTKVFGRVEVTRNDIRPQGIPSRYNFGTPVFASPQDIIIRRHIQSEQQWPNRSYFFVGPKRIIQDGEPIGRKRDETAGHWEPRSYYPAFGISHVEGGDKWVRYHLPADPDHHSEDGDLLYWNKKNFYRLEHKVALSLQYIGARGWNSLRMGWLRLPILGPQELLVYSIIPTEHVPADHVVAHPPKPAGPFDQVIGTSSLGVRQDIPTTHVVENENRTISAASVPVQQDWVYRESYGYDYVSTWGVPSLGWLRFIKPKGWVHHTTPPGLNHRVARNPQEVYTEFWNSLSLEDETSFEHLGSGKMRVIRQGGHKPAPQPKPPVLVPTHQFVLPMGTQTPEDFGTLWADPSLPPFGCGPDGCCSI